MKRGFFLVCVCGLAWSTALPSHAAQPWLSAAGDRPRAADGNGDPWVPWPGTVGPIPRGQQWGGEEPL